MCEGSEINIIPIPIPIQLGCCGLTVCQLCCCG